MTADNKYDYIMFPLVTFTNASLDLQNAMFNFKIFW